MERAVITSLHIQFTTATFIKKEISRSLLRNCAGYNTAYSQ